MAAQSLEDSDAMDLESFLINKATLLDEKLVEYQAKGSGWVLNSVITLNVICSKFIHLCRLRARSYVKTPGPIAAKKCVVNVQNYYDDKCFLYSILAARKAHKLVHPERVNHYENYLSKFKYKESDFPMRIDNIANFERQNPQYVINVINYTPFSDVKKFRNDDDDDDDHAQIYMKHPCFDLVYRSHHYAICHLKKHVD